MYHQVVADRGQQHLDLGAVGETRQYHEVHADLVERNGRASFGLQHHQVRQLPLGTGRQRNVLQYDGVSRQGNDRTCGPDAGFVEPFPQPAALLPGIVGPTALRPIPAQATAEADPLRSDRSFGRDETVFVEFQREHGAAAGHETLESSQHAKFLSQMFFLRSIVIGARSSPRADAAENCNGGRTGYGRDGGSNFEPTPAGGGAMSRN